jgi:ATP-dependent DNA ligase
MKALPVEKLPECDWLYEIKHDGYRALALKEGKDVRLVSRNKKAFDYPQLLHALKSLPVERVIPDGEICCTRRERPILISAASSFSTCPFINLPEKNRGRWGQRITPAVMKRRRWVKPVLVAQVKFTEWTLDDQLRQPVFLRLRTDEEAKEVVRE